MLGFGLGVIFILCFLRFNHTKEKEKKGNLPGVGNSSVPTLSWNTEDGFIFNHEKQCVCGEATFLNFPCETTGVLPLCPHWALSPLRRISGLFLWGALAHFRRTFCVTAERASQKCLSLHNGLGDIPMFILWITTNAPVFLKANTGLYRELSRFTVCDLFEFVGTAWKAM